MSSAATSNDPEHLYQSWLLSSPTEEITVSIVDCHTSRILRLQTSRNSAPPICSSYSSVFSPKPAMLNCPNQRKYIPAHLKRWGKELVRRSMQLANPAAEEPSTDGAQSCTRKGFRNRTSFCYLIISIDNLTPSENHKGGPLPTTMIQ